MADFTDRNERESLRQAQRLNELVGCDPETVDALLFALDNQGAELSMLRRRVIDLGEDIVWYETNCKCAQGDLR